MKAATANTSRHFMSVFLGRFCYRRRSQLDLAASLRVKHWASACASLFFVVSSSLDSRQSAILRWPPSHRWKTNSSCSTMAHNTKQAAVGGGNQRQTEERPQRLRHRLTFSCRGSVSSRRPGPHCCLPHPRHLVFLADWRRKTRLFTRLFNDFSSLVPHLKAVTCTGSKNAQVHLVVLVFRRGISADYLQVGSGSLRYWVFPGLSECVPYFLSVSWCTGINSSLLLPSFLAGCLLASRFVHPLSAPALPRNDMCSSRSNVYTHSHTGSLTQTHTHQTAGETHKCTKSYLLTYRPAGLTHLTHATRQSGCSLFSPAPSPRHRFFFPATATPRPKSASDDAHRTPFSSDKVLGHRREEDKRRSSYPLDTVPERLTRTDTNRRRSWLAQH